MNLRREISMDSLEIDDIAELTYQIKYLRKDMDRLILVIGKLAEALDDAAIR